MLEAYGMCASLPFWERMSGCSNQMIGKLYFRSQHAIPEFLSTHPSGLMRIQSEGWWRMRGSITTVPPERYSRTALLVS